MRSEKELRKDLRRIKRIMTVKYGKKKDTLKLILDRGETKALKSMEKIIRATEVCTLSYVLEIGGALNKSIYYPYWIFSNNKEYREKVWKKHSKKVKRAFKKWFIKTHFKKIEIKGKIYYQLK